VSLLPPLREVIRRHGLGADKSLGQHFLLDLNLTGKIVRAAGPLGHRNVVEVGPGPGGLTRSLLAAAPTRVVAIERDPRCVAALEELVASYPGRLEIVAGDALAVDPVELVPKPRCLVANLPYNISTALLLRWLPRITAWESLTLMFQKEVADRLVAAPGSKDYGRLTVLVQWLTAPKRLFEIPPRAFVPPPRITSTVVRIEPRPQPLAPCRREDLERVTAAAFGQRRKMLRGSLKPLGLDPSLVGIDPTVRAEDVPVEGFCALARELARQTQ
jgi:16S rRNA (adenine1518-N6/adenine1519-N6)-dimethyltransferase